MGQSWKGEYGAATRVRISSILLAVIMCVLVSYGAACGDGGESAQWTQPAAGVELSQLWSRAGTELDGDVAGAKLTDMSIIWAQDSSVFRAEITARTEDNYQISLGTARQAGSDELTVLVNLLPLAGETTRQSQGLAAAPSVDRVLSVLDSVGVRGLAEATSAAPGEGEGLILSRNPGLLSAGAVSDYAQGRVLLELSEGGIKPLEESTPVADLEPAELLVLWNAELAGSTARGQGEPLAFCFVH